MSFAWPRYVREAYVRGVGFASGLLPAERERRRIAANHRRQTEQLFNAIGRSTQTRFSGQILVDGTWDNPNYWYRFTLLRAALGLAVGQEIGVLGRHSRSPVRQTFDAFGINHLCDLTVSPLKSAEALVQATALLATVEDAAGILALRLPNDLPSAMVYDGILKRLRQATLDPRNPAVALLLAEALQTHAAVQAIFDREMPTLVVLSHAINFDCGALAWEAVRRGIPAVVLYGNYGVPRFWKIGSAADLTDSVNRPTGREIDELPADVAGLMAGLGKAYIDRRLSGQTDDIGARYAYQRRTGKVDRIGLCESFGWNPATPIIAVYASNWFDFPHGCGMTSFVDFLDWLRVTVRTAGQNPAANWIFKAHPCDEWYGGITLADLMGEGEHPHVRLAPTSWNGESVMRAVDGVVTVLGTAGLEYAVQGKPVLVADRGWYHDAGFAVWARTREEYLGKLRDPWWEGFDAAASRARALTFAGWYFCHPDWQSGLVLGDDSEQAGLYQRFPALLAAAPDALEREIATIGEWWVSPHRHYHVWKMRNSVA